MTNLIDPECAGRTTHRRARTVYVGPRARRAALVLLATSSLQITGSSGSLAQQQDPPTKGPATVEGRPRKSAAADPQPPKAAVPAKPALEADLRAVEDELAQYLQFRGEVPPEGAARLELLIDLRVLARWLLAAAAAAPAGSDLQVCGWFRANEFRGAAAALADRFKEMPKPTPAQAEAMAKVHALTFALPPPRDVRATDDACRDVGLQLVLAAGPLPPEVRQLPLMRPGTRSLERPAAASTPTIAAAADPLARANALAVSPALKKQVLALVAAADAARQTAATLPSIPVPPANAPPSLVAAAAVVERKRDDAVALAATAATALDVAEALSGVAAAGGGGVASDVSVPPAAERRLADGLALYVDPRTRPAGERRLAALDALAQTVARVRRLELDPDLRRKIAPTIAWAADHPELGPRLMAAVEGFAEAARRAAARAAGPSADPPGQAAAAPRDAKAVADAMRVVAAERESLLGELAALARPGAPADVGRMAQRVDAMRAALDAADLFDRVPGAVQLLLTHRPRPTGGLERRVAVAMATLTDPRPAGNRDDATHVLADVVRLADLAGEADAPNGGGPPLPPEVVKVYARNRLAAVDAKRKDLVGELLAALAGGKDPDPARFQRLEQVRAVRLALADAAVFEQALRNGPLLNRWADWPVDPAELQAVFAPYRAAVAATVEALAADATLPGNWDALRARYAPAMRAVIRAADQTNLCAALPTGWPGHCARLMTPMDGQPFAADRHAAFALKLWARAEKAGDAKAADAAAEAMRGRR